MWRSVMTVVWICDCHRRRVKCWSFVVIIYTSPWWRQWRSRVISVSDPDCSWQCITAASWPQCKVSIIHCKVWTFAISLRTIRIILRALCSCQAFAIVTFLSLIFVSLYHLSASIDCDEIFDITSRTIASVQLAFTC